jgi:hypothetical protein
MSELMWLIISELMWLINNIWANVAVINNIWANVTNKYSSIHAASATCFSLKCKPPTGVKFRGIRYRSAYRWKV